MASVNPSPAAPLCIDDIEQIIEGIENFCMGPIEDEELTAIWQPYVDKLREQMHVLTAAPELLEAARAVLEQFDAGYFVRNTDSDGCSDWAIEAAKPLAALARMKAAIAKAEGR